MKKYFYIRAGNIISVVLFFSTVFCSAQQVVSSSGKELIGTNLSLNFTFGETFVESYNSVSLGFHQGSASDECAITIVDSAISAACNTSTGAAFVTASGGVPLYKYQWSNGDTIANIDSLASGIYMVTVTDAAGCGNFKAVIISNTNAPAITVNTITTVNCYGGNNGAIDISVSGGATPYSYLWSNGATTQDIGNLAMSPYEIIVTGANGCSSAQSIFVSQPAALTATSAAVAASCGNADGSATATATGGTLPYTYIWSNGSNVPQVTNVPAQTYTVTITDANNCTTTVLAAIGETGGAMVQIDSVISAGCGGTGSIYVNVSGGATPYSYSWTNGTTTQNLINSAAGNYGLIVTDSNGCTGAVSASITSQQIMFDPICLITVDTATGTNKLVWEKTFGTGIAFYKIYKEQTIAGVYQLTGTRPFDSLSVFTDSVANPLIRSWRYKLSAVDSCGNESALSPEHKTIHLTINQGLGNTVNLIWDYYQGFSYGTYYIWRYKPQTGWVLRDSLPGNLTSWTDFTPPTPFALKYLIEIKHPDGCTATKSAENHNSSRSNKSYPLAPPANNLSATTTEIDETGSCDGSATIVVSGGVSPYSYLWSNNDTTAFIDSLCAGAYTCTITDTDGDTTTVSVVILLTNVSKIGEEKMIVKVFPNPNKGIFTLAVNSKNQNLSILVFNLFGEIVYQSKVPNFKASAEIDISKNSNGIYFLQVISSQGNSVPVKIVLQ